ncbi:hypothetical protein ACLMJK_008223 [Lecanora helva]
MYLSLIFTASLAISSIAALPTTFPLADGFPNPNPEQLALIEKEAHGSLPNSPLPTTLGSTGATVLQLIALNELFEADYFSRLLSNVTNEVPGYEAEALLGLDRQYVIDTITTIVNQEKLHALGVNGILTSANHDAIKPCTFQAPVTTFTQAIALAATFTDIVLGALPGAQTVFAKDGGDESPLVALFGSVIAQEGEQAGFFRFSQKKTPSAAPFLTGVQSSFAFSALQLFIVPGSCPQPLSDIHIPTFGPLNIVAPPVAANSSIIFSVKGPVSEQNNSIVYLSGQNLPVTVPISSVVPNGDLYQFSAEFPFDSGFSNGLTIAALVKGSQKYNGSDAVAADTVYGPGLIEVG